MSAAAFIRVSHRWVSIGFTLAVVVNLAAWGFEDPPMWIGFLALGPLVYLLFTGLYLFALPYLARRR